MILLNLQVVFWHWVVRCPIICTAPHRGHPASCRTTTRSSVTRNVYTTDFYFDPLVMFWYLVHSLLHSGKILRKKILWFCSKLVCIFWGRTFRVGKISWIWPNCKHHHFKPCETFPLYGNRAKYVHINLCISLFTGHPVYFSWQLGEPIVYSGNLAYFNIPVNWCKGHLIWSTCQHVQLKIQSIC